MNKKETVEREINFKTKLFQDEDIIYTGDLKTISALQNANYLTEIFEYDTEAINVFENVLKSVPLFTPFVSLMKLIKKIIGVVSKKSNYKRNKDEQKKKVLSEIEKLLLNNSDISSFTSELNVISGKKGISLTSLADKACVDYSYLNKFINNKLPIGAVVSRDFTLKLCLALELNLHETNELITKAGYIICGQNERDIVISVCIENLVGLMTTNEILYDKGLRTL